MADTTVANAQGNTNVLTERISEINSDDRYTFDALSVPLLLACFSMIIRCLFVFARISSWWCVAPFVHYYSRCFGGCALEPSGVFRLRILICGCSDFWWPRKLVWPGCCLCPAKVPAEVRKTFSNFIYISILIEAEVASPRTQRSFTGFHNFSDVIALHGCCS